MQTEFVVFGAPTDWCDVIYYDLQEKKEGLYIDGKMSAAGHMGRTLYSLLYSKKVKSKTLKRVLFKLIDRLFKKQNIKVKYIIFHDWNRLAYDIEYLQYLRKHYQNIKLIFIFTNIYEKSGVVRFSSLNWLKQNFDLILTYDMEDADRNGVKYCPTVYSKIPSNTKGNACDVLFVGSAKERLPMLLSVYQELSMHGVKCLFYINGVKPEEQKYVEHIHYNHPISYVDTIAYVQDAKCILDIAQVGSNAVTLRCCEAIFYGKKLITTANIVGREDFYDPCNIYILNEKNINGLKSFLDGKNNVEYDKKATEEFSTKNLLTFIVNSFKMEKTVTDKDISYII